MNPYSVFKKKTKLNVGDDDDDDDSESFTTMSCGERPGSRILPRDCRLSGSCCHDGLNHEVVVAAAAVLTSDER